MIPFLLLLIAALGISCAAEPKKAVIPLDALEGFTQVGTATITDTDNGIVVYVSVSPGSAVDDPQPMHIHLGTCGPNLGAVEFVLESVVGGESTTVIETDFSALFEADRAINVHKSVAEIKQYTSCGAVVK